MLKNRKKSLDISLHYAFSSVMSDDPLSSQAWIGVRMLYDVENNWE
jgi:hypothetical protein